MFNEVGNLYFDQELQRYCYQEEWPEDTFSCPLYDWLISSHLGPFQSIGEQEPRRVIYSERRSDPLAIEVRSKQIVILGPIRPNEESEMHSADPLRDDEMRSADQLSDDEIKVELVLSGHMGWFLTITLLSELEPSSEALSSLSMKLQASQLRRAA